MRKQSRAGRGDCSVHGGIGRGDCSVHGGIGRGDCSVHAGIGRGDCSAHAGIGRGDCSAHAGIGRGDCSAHGGIDRGDCSAHAGIIEFPPDRDQCPCQVARAFGLYYAKLFVGKDDAATLQGYWPSVGAEHVIFNR